MRALLAFLLALCGLCQPILAESPAVRILNSTKYESLPSIISENEWKELQLDRLITTLDRTKTSFGQWGLTYLLHPISDKEELLHRQKIISFLVENPQVLQTFQQKLSEIKKYEKSLLSYWNKKDELSNNCEQFYYKVPFLRDYLNKSNAALNLGVATQVFDAGRNLLASLCLKGVSDEFSRWSMKVQDDFDLKRGIWKGLEEPIRQHSWKLDLCKDQKEYTVRDALNAELNGTWADRYHVYSQGYTVDYKSLGFPSELVVPATKATGFLQKSLAFVGASTRTLVYDYFWGVSLLSIARQIAFMHTSLKDLTVRVNETGFCFTAMMHLFNDIHRYSHVFGEQMCYQKNHEKGILFMNDSAKKQRDHQTLYQYSRGHILTMHKAIKKEKSSFVSVLQTIALLDAYCSIAQLIKESEQEHNKFSFVTFVDADTPFIAYKNAWLPLLNQKQAVINDLYMGGTYAGKMIITGPNGGGKSTLLKTYGIAVVLAQSWGIVSADYAQQTLFNGLKTGMAPHEDLQQGLSTFMAEKKCMEHLEASIKKTDMHNKILVLVDEPYKGTVDDESAKRIYSFGMNAVQYPYTLLCIATHVKKPIFLATDTKGIFANYHVEIKETSYGNFERLFTLKQGPATWWFENEGQRGRFVDWISVLLEQQEKNKTYDFVLGK